MTTHTHDLNVTMQRNSQDYQWLRVNQWAQVGYTSSKYTRLQQSHWFAKQHMHSAGTEWWTYRKQKPINSNTVGFQQLQTAFLWVDLWCKDNGKMNIFSHIPVFFLMKAYIIEKRTIQGSPRLETKVGLETVCKSWNPTVYRCILTIAWRMHYQPDKTPRLDWSQK